MTERPEENPYPTEAARQSANTKRLVIIIGILGGAVVALVLRRYSGG